MNRLPKKILFLFFVCLASAAYYLLSLPHSVDAAPISCPSPQDYHSLRPQPACPLDTKIHDTATFCGNDLILKNSITVGKGSATSCKDNGDGTETCEFSTNQTKPIKIDLSGAKLPIMGLTEGVINSQQQNDDIPDTQKVNEYVSWYLNGITGRAEYAFLDPDNEKDRRKIIDFSGPIKKLLPWYQQTLLRNTTIENAGVTQFNQIIACGYGLEIPIVSDVLNLHHLGFSPGPCYGFETIPIVLEKETLRLADWKDHKAPLPDEYKTFTDWWLAYRRWRGRFCGKITLPKEITIGIPGLATVSIPIPGGGTSFSLCVNDPANVLKPDFWAFYFPNIPFSSTEDRKGDVETSTVGVQPEQNGVEISNVRFSNQKPAELFFAHMAETNELASILQETFVPEELPMFGPTSQVFPSKYCDLVNIRTNPGDDLYAGEIGGTLSYTADFSCDFKISQAVPSPSPSHDCQALFNGSCVETNWTCQSEFGTADCSTGYKCGRECVPPPTSQSISECTKDIYVSLSLITKTPLADKVWSKLVAGNSAVFKRIFPKIGPGGPILSLLDMPASTKVSYTSLDGTPAYAGNPEGQRSGESAELYFPHIGGIYEYFLKGIQTALRPKGYGEQVISGSIDTIPSAGNIDCNRSAADVSLPRTLDRQATLQLALNWVAGQPGNHVLDCYNDVIKRSGEKGINPAFSLLIWLNESNASNYNISVEDFGIHDSSVRGFSAQITRFLELPGGYKANYPECFGNGKNEMESFLRLFRSGNCTDDAGLQYAQYLPTLWNWISSCPNFPRYPTDTSCY